MVVGQRIEGSNDGHKAIVVAVAIGDICAAAIRPTAGSATSQFGGHEVVKKWSNITVHSRQEEQPGST